MEPIIAICMLLALSYFCVTLAIRSPPPFRRLFLDVLLQNADMQRLFEQHGVKIGVKRWQAIRFWAIVSWLGYAYASVFLFTEPLTWYPLLIGVLVLLVTSPVRFSPLWLIFQLQDKQVQSGRDGALIAFVRLYEMDRRKKATQLSAFCEQSARYLPILKQDLLAFSQKVTLEGHDKAFAWLESRFPEQHEFAHHICTLLQTAERLEDPGAFLHENSQFLEKLSRDYYERRRKSLSPWLNVLSTVPSFIVFFMIIVLIMKYIGIVKGQISV